MNDELVKRCNGPDDVSLWTTPWVSGTRAAAYFGPVNVEVFSASPKSSKNNTRRLNGAMSKLLRNLQDKAYKLEANAVVGIEVTIDPFAEEKGKDGVRFNVIGTAARLEPLL